MERVKENDKISEVHEFLFGIHCQQVYWIELKNLKKIF